MNLRWRKTATRPGDRYGEWTVLARSPGYIGHGLAPHFDCKCSCGFVKSIDGSSLRRGHSTKCNQCSRAGMRSSLDLTGHRWGTRTVIRFLYRSRSNSIVWECRCDCGSVGPVVQSDILKGKSRSCRECARRASTELLIGRRFGSWIVISGPYCHWCPSSYEQKKPVLKYECKCACGRREFVIGQSFKNGDSTSCRYCSWGMRSYEVGRIVRHKDGTWRIKVATQQWQALNRHTAELIEGRAIFSTEEVRAVGGRVVVLPKKRRELADCLQCGQVVRVYPAKFATQDRFFCNRDCYAAHQLSIGPRRSDWMNIAAARQSGETINSVASRFAVSPESVRKYTKLFNQIGESQMAKKAQPKFVAVLAELAALRPVSIQAHYTLAKCVHFLLNDHAYQDHHGSDFDKINEEIDSFVGLFPGLTRSLVCEMYNQFPNLKDWEQHGTKKIHAGTLAAIGKRQNAPRNEHEDASEDDVKRGRPAAQKLAELMKERDQALAAKKSAEAAKVEAERRLSRALERIGDLEMRLEEAESRLSSMASTPELAVAGH